MVMFTFSVFDWKYPFWENLVQKIKIVSLSRNLVSRLIKLLELNKRINTEAAAHRCSVAVLKNQKQPLADVLQNWCNIQRKTIVLEFLFNKVAGLQLSCEYCEIIKNSFFYKTPPVASSEKSLNFPGKHQWWRRNRFIFLINTTE